MTFFANPPFYVDKCAVMMYITVISDGVETEK